MKIEFHYTYIIIALGFILTGYFSNLLVFTSIIIIHELGHFTIAKLFHLKSEKIIIYPFGGITKMNNLLNTPINKELAVAISGIIFQSIYYSFIIFLYQRNIIREYIFNEFTMYYYAILIFNILPIYPLDGGKIINLLLSKLYPYKKSIIITIIISLITLFILIINNYYQHNYTTIIIVGLILSSIYRYYQNIDYLFNRFLLERYLYKIIPPRTININKIDYIYKEKYHIIKEKNTYLTEKQYLKRRFSKKTSKIFDI